MESGLSSWSMAIGSIFLSWCESLVSALLVCGTAMVIPVGQPRKPSAVARQGKGAYGEAATPVSGKTVATVSLEIGGKAATARFPSAG